VRLAKILALILAGFVLSAYAKDEGFSGKWVLDKHSPRPGDAPDKLETKIKQDGSGVTIQSTFKEPADAVVPLVYLGVMTSRIRLNTDGQEEETLIGPFTMRSKTTMDGNQMLTDWTAQVSKDQVQGHWTHTLSEDGKHMTLAIKESSTHGQHAEATLYFVRK
jgi:hypothetical protein